MVVSAAAPVPDVVAFALPLPRGLVGRVEDLAVRLGGSEVSGLRARPILRDFAPDGTSRTLRSVWLEFPRPASAASGSLAIDVSFSNPVKSAIPVVPPAKLSYRDVSKDAPAVVRTAAYRVVRRSADRLEAEPRAQKDETLFAGVLPRWSTTFDDGYLARIGLLGDLVTARDAKSRGDLAPLAFLSDAFTSFADGAMGAGGYPVAPGSLALASEAWLYDRCATFLLAYAHTGEARHRDHALLTCAHYARAIGLTGDDRGFFSGKEGRDAKYSHLRGLVAYYALTGDDAALTAGRAIAEMWEKDTLFVAPYRAGTVRGADKLWTERLLAASIEGGIYGFELTGDARFLASARALVRTAVRHVTTRDPAELATLTKTSFPPQGCFVHSALQHGEGNADVPWCSSWMSELLLDPLLRYRGLTGETDVDAIFVSLARSMRDAGTTYFRSNPLGDAFLTPKEGRSGAVGSDDARLLVPLYGYGIDHGRRVTSGEWSDFEHCPDATAVTALALRTLRRTGKLDQKPTPASSSLVVNLSAYATDGASLSSLHSELLFCAREALRRAARPGRDPRAAGQAVLAAALAAGDEGAQAKALEAQKIGWPVYSTSPGRKLSWWFNTAIAELAWLSDSP